MGARHAIAIDLGRKRFRALHASAGQSVRIKRALSLDYPVELAVEDPQALGHWIGQQMKAGGFPRGKAVISIGREHVGVKRMLLPTNLDSELPDMTRLAMQRELPFDADSAVIDFVPVDRGPTSTTVLAVAVPRKMVEFAEAVALAAGYGVERITLRTMGVAVLLNGLPRDADAAGGGMLGIDVTGEGVEFCLLANGAIRFSRAAEVPQPGDRLAIADAVVTETRRTWMSYRIGDDAPEVQGAVVMGDRRVSAYAATPLKEMLKIPVQVLESHPRIETGSQDLDGLWPLAGLLLEPSQGRAAPLIDFANPRKAPDLSARTRIRRMLAAAAVLLIAGLAWTLARNDLQSLRDQAATLKKQQLSETPGYARYVRTRYRLDHLRHWESIHADWLKHASHLASMSPPPDRVVFDSWSGTLKPGKIEFNKSNGKWASSQDVTIVLDGEAATRETADAFRESLVQTSIYNANATGAETAGGKRMPFGFTYRLRTRAGSPGTADNGNLAAPNSEKPAGVTAQARPPRRPPRLSKSWPHRREPANEANSPGDALPGSCAVGEPVVHLLHCEFVVSH